MRLVNSARNLQFAAKERADGGFVFKVSPENDPSLTLDTVTVREFDLTAELLYRESAAWENGHSAEDIAELRKAASKVRMRVH